MRKDKWLTGKHLVVEMTNGSNGYFNKKEVANITCRINGLKYR